MRKSISPDVALVPKLINVSQSNVEIYGSQIDCQATEEVRNFSNASDVV